MSFNHITNIHTYIDEHKYTHRLSYIQLLNFLLFLLNSGSFLQSGQYQLILRLGLTNQLQTAKVEPFMQTAWVITSLRIPDPDSSSMFSLNHHQFQLMELKMKVQDHLMKLNMRGHWEMVFEEH